MANGEGPNGKKQMYDWKRFERTVRELSPSTVIFSDIGPDIRWTGNEKGVAGWINWNNLDTVGFTRGIGAPSTDTLNKGNINGKNWIPAECDVSIRPGWFYHANEDDKVKAPEQLFDLYLKSVGRGTSLLLNVPPDNRGLIPEKDAAALSGFKKLKDESFGNDLLKNIIPQLTNVKTGQSGLSYKTEYRFNNNFEEAQTYIEFRFPAAQKINCIVLKEKLDNGQKIGLMNAMLQTGTYTFFPMSVTTVGNKRIITFPEKEATAITFVMLRSKNYPVLYKPEAYLIDEKLVEK